MVHRGIAAGIFAFLVALVAAPASSAAEQTTESFDISALETRLFQHDCSNRLSMEQRLGRVEQFVFGSRLNGDADQRVARICKIVSNLAKEMSVEMHVSRSSVVPSITVPELSSAPVDSRPSGVDWTLPLQIGLAQQIKELEEQVFSETFNNDPIVTRIHRLENQVYPRILISNKEELTLRVGRLYDRVSELKEERELPVKDVRPFDEVTYSHEVASNEASLREHDSESYQQRTGSELASATVPVASAISNDQFSKNSISDTTSVVNRKSHKFRRVMFAAIKSLALSAAYVVENY